MKNIIRKELRKLIIKIDELSRDEDCSQFEYKQLQKAIKEIIIADYHDFHVNPKKRYYIPKKDYVYDSQIIDDEDTPF